MLDSLTVATLATTATPDLEHNAAAIRAAVEDAGHRGARVLVTCECALVGYPGAARSDFTDLDWGRVAALERELGRVAERAGLILVLGSASRQAAPALDDDEGAKDPASTMGNEAVVLGGSERQRYRKRLLTPLDRLHFAPGDDRRAAWLQVDGWRLGLSICFEVRVGRLWAAQARAGVDGFLHLAHMAGEDAEPGVKARVIPALYAARAAEWATPLLLANTSAADRWLDSGLWDARGMNVASRGDGLLVTEMRPREAHPAWYQNLRACALAEESDPPAR